MHFVNWNYNDAQEYWNNDWNIDVIMNDDLILCMHTSTYDNDACNNEIFMMKNCFDIHDLIFHLCYLSLSWFEDCSKEK